MKVFLASKNPGKVREIAAILGDACSLVAPPPDWEQPEETELDYRGNALLKARALADVVRAPVLADDSGIEVYALGGGPGPRSARFAGDGATDEQNLARMLEEIKTKPDGMRGALYRCVAVLVEPDGTEHVAEETVEGCLITKRRGSGGFGYDPIFVAKGQEGTMAELSAEEKDTISHRGKAFRALIPALRALDA